MKHKGFTEIQKGLYYNEADGSPWSTRQSGSSNPYYHNKPIKLNSIGKAGYYQVRLNGKSESWHSLVWSHFNGSIPDGYEIDHKNNVLTDNLIENLQILTHTANSRACKRQTNNKSGYPGVREKGNKFVATITMNGKKKHLGYFNSKEDAFESYKEAKIKYHGVDSVRF